MASVHSDGKNYKSQVGKTIFEYADFLNIRVPLTSRSKPTKIEKYKMKPIPYVDFTTQKCILKDSFHFFKNIFHNIIFSSSIHNNL